jgi:dTDP-4-dehydrorhamnose reductase
MKILIIGASGLVGSHIAEAALRSGHEVVGTTRTTPSERYCATLDLKDWPATVALVDKAAPDVIVHAAGFCSADGCEADIDRCREENASQPVALGRLCAERGLRFVFASSAYAKFPELNNYASAKRYTEISLLELRTPLILRLINVWGKDAKRLCFPYQVLRAVHAGESLRCATDQLGNPTWSGDIGAWAVQMIEHGAHGIWNVASPFVMNRLEWARAIAPEGEYEARTGTQGTQIAARPADATLDTRELQTHFPRVCRQPHDLEGIFGPMKK